MPVIRLFLWGLHLSVFQVEPFPVHCCNQGFRMASGEKNLHVLNDGTDHLLSSGIQFAHDII